MDKVDIEILKLIQTNAELSRRVGVSKTPCWNRIRKLEEIGVINQRATLLNRKSLDLPIVVFLSISVGRHSLEWTARFDKLISSYDQIIEVHRLTGSGADYMLKIVAASIEDYDSFQQVLIGKIEFTSMSTSVSLQEMKYRVELPLKQLAVS
jgi:Lrp/AsnC family transcriptional regulator